MTHRCTVAESGEKGCLGCRKTENRTGGGRCAQNFSKIVLKIIYFSCLEGCATRRNSSELTSNFTNFFLGSLRSKSLENRFKNLSLFLNTNNTNCTNNLFLPIFTNGRTRPANCANLFLGRCAQNFSKIVLKIIYFSCLEGCATRRNSSELTSNFTIQPLKIV